MTKAEALVAWLEACPKGQDRTVTIEVGVHTGCRVAIFMDQCWICKDGRECEDDNRLGGRKYYAEGRTVRAALSRLHVPRARKAARR